jgi:uncharacterized protein (UPF0276 family)
MQTSHGDGNVTDRVLSHGALSGCVGIGLRTPHVGEIMSTHPGVQWLEVHAENYMGGGPIIRALAQIRQEYPISLHSVGLSLGSMDGPDADHLSRLKRLIKWIEPVLVSEHLSWSIAEGVYLNHLLPLPYTEETLDILCRNIEEAQSVLGRQLLIENPSSYLRFAISSIAEPEFLAEIVRRTECGLLCDVNNIYVTCRNFAQDPVAYVRSLPPYSVREIHLAGHAVNTAEGKSILIDDHGSSVCEAVWDLFALAVARFGPMPTLIEWDINIPELSVLLAEAGKAQQVLSPGQVTGTAYVG